MIIKKFQAKTENDAVEIARKELGANVVIMNVKTIKKKGLFGFLRGTTVEVTVALEEERERQTPIRTSSITHPVQQTATGAQKEVFSLTGTLPTASELTAAMQSPSLTALEQLARMQEKSFREQEEVRKADNVGSLLEEKLDNLEHLLKQQLDNTEADKNKEAKGEEETEEQSEQMKFMKLLYNTMIDNEVHEKYANQILEEVEKNANPNMPFDYCLTNVYQKMILKFGQTREILPAAKGPKVVFFVGPTGVGKTTTIAKIASKFCVEEKKKVALLTADTYRIAAAEQLRTYANILEVPFRIVYSAQDVEQFFHEFEQYDYILIDTAGHSHLNEEQRINSALILHSLDEIAETEVYLVISATTKYRDLLSIADIYKEMANYALIFTKLDETASYGNLLNLRLYTGAELSYVTCGQNVPDDIDKFNPQKTVKQILGGKQA